MYYEKCPKCGGEVISKHHIENKSYYLECKNKGYGCWHENCSEMAAQYYPLTIVHSKDDDLALRMREVINDDEIDYYHE